MSYHIFHLETHGRMNVYRRIMKNEGYPLRYFVADYNTNKIVKEFRQRKTAVNFAKTNQHG